MLVSSTDIRRPDQLQVPFRPVNMQSLRSFWTQHFPPAPTFTESDIPASSQVGRVFIVTGGNSGLGLELVRQLYPTGATIYLACRSRERAEMAIQDVISAAAATSMDTDMDMDMDRPVRSRARLKFLHLDLSDLSAVRDAAAAFAAQESRLDILWNNAGIGGSPVGTTTKQGIEGHLGINCVAPLLFTRALLPRLQAASRDSGSAAGSVRVIWTASLSVETHAPHGGVDEAQLDGGATRDPHGEYAQSKVGNWWLAIEGARRYGGGKDDGIVSVAQNPGQIDTDIWKRQPWWVMMILRPTLHPTRTGTCTMLYAGFSGDLALEENNGTYVMPWGRTRPWRQCPRSDIVKAIEDGGPQRFWEWCEGKFREHL